VKSFKKIPSYEELMKYVQFSAEFTEEKNRKKEIEIEKTVRVCEEKDF